VIRDGNLIALAVVLDALDEQVDEPPLLRPGYLLHDRDAKFTAAFDDLLESAGFKPKRLPHRSPNLNPYAESWLGTIRRECLDHFLVLGEGHLRYLVSRHVDFYNTVRSHGAMGGPLEPSAMPAEGPVLCEHWLGGLGRQDQTAREKTLLHPSGEAA
jgi:transposase InsO family protein